MRFDPKAGVTDDQGKDKGRRSHGRLPQELLFCDLGEVMDLSATGMRVLCRKKLAHKRLTVKIWDEDVKLHLTADVAWTRRKGFFRHEIGLAFVAPDEETRKILTKISTNHRIRRVTPAA